MLRDAIAAHESHAQALILLFARLADIVSTRLASPRLVLEANPIVRSLGWPFAWATLAVCGIAYLPERGPSLALSASVLSLFVAAGNLSRGWAMRAIGEEAYRAHMRRVLAAAKPAQVYLAIAAASALVGSAGALLLVLEPDPDGAAWSFAMGILLYAGATWFHSSVAVRRMQREAAHATPHP
jgi:hypothetical protein